MKRIEPSPIEDAKSEIRYVEHNGMFSVGIRHALSVLLALERVEQDQVFDKRGYSKKIEDSEAVCLSSLKMCRELLKYVRADLAAEEAARVAEIRKYVGE